MAHRNVLEQAQKGRKMLNSNRSMSMNELEQLIDYSYQCVEKGYDACSVILEAVTEAFYFGAATGIRQGMSHSCKN